MRDASGEAMNAQKLCVHHFLSRASTNIARVRAMRLANRACPAIIAATVASAFIVILLVSLQLDFHAAAVLPRIHSNATYRPVESAILN